MKIHCIPFKYISINVSIQSNYTDMNSTASIVEAIKIEICSLHYTTENIL